MPQEYTLDSVAEVARSDLTLALSHTEEHLHWRFIQSIRMITTALGDRDNFEKTWNRWRNKESPNLITFEQLMTR